MRRFIFVAVLVCLSATPARAQDDLLRRCSAAVPDQSGLQAEGKVIDQFRQMCGQVVSSFSAMQPGVGIAFSGGNPVLGAGGTLGTRLGFIPRASISARANIALTEMPGLFDNYVAEFSEGEGLRQMERVGTPLGSLQVDAALGVFNGLPLGLGAVDLLGSVSFVPKVTEIGLSEAITNIGGGARIGILKQGILMPGLSVSGMYRSMGTMGFGDRSMNDDPGFFSANLKNVSLRTVASKSLLVLDLAVGAGYDRYTSDLGLGWKVTCATNECRNANPSAPGQPLALSSEINGKLTTAAWNVFADAGINLLFLRLVGEVGYQKSMDPIGIEDLKKADLPVDQPFTSKSLKDGNLFGSIGLRLTI
jgi:hypothetical protein